MRRTPLFLLVALLSGLLPATDAAALVLGKTDIEVWEIQATRKNKEISSELRPIAEQLRKQFKYTGFKLVRVRKGTVDLKETFVARLSLGYSARVTPLVDEGKRIQMAVEVKRLMKKRVNAKITLNRGGLQLFGGWDFPGEKDDVMIVGFRAR